MRLEDKTYEELKIEVANCIQQCNLFYPLSVHNLAQALKIKLIPYCCLTEEEKILAIKASNDAFLCEKGYDVFIFFNDSIFEERREMSILHEIGHYILEHNHDSYKSNMIKEAEAAFFAKYIKAPPPLINLLPNISLWAIRSTFKLSEQAAGFALSNYKKWKKYSQGKLKNYETILVNHIKSQEQNKKDKSVKEVG